MINLDKDVRAEMYRQRRLKVLFMKIGIAAGLLLLFIFALFKKFKTYSGFILDPTEFVTVSYKGFDKAGQAELRVNREKLASLLDKAHRQYENAIWPLDKKYDMESFMSLIPSFDAVLDRSEGLSNGDELKITAKMDEEAADELRLRLKYTEIPFTVEGLPEGTFLTEEDIFGQLTVSVNGISPMITVELINGSENEFIQSLEYKAEPEKEYYEKGDKIKITAHFDSEKALEAHYEIPDDATVMEYTVPGDIKYVESASEIDKETLEEAIELGKQCFTGANEYGLRIFTEAGLPYSWEGTKDYTFEWSDPRILSAYVETMKEDHRGKSSKLFNYLELAYEVHIRQANGVGCDAEAVVCFDQLTVDDEGNVDLNPDSAQLFTASYLDRNIKNTIRGWFGDEYDLDKINLTEYGLLE